MSKVVFVTWGVMGLTVYFTYGRRRSALAPKQ
jgi:heme/copper-type cytochrome/quinol oxidase subunit 2